MPYNTEQRCWLVKEYAKTNNAQAVRRNWTAKYGTNPPNEKTIYRLRNKFNATGSVLNFKKSGRPISVTTDSKKYLVSQAVVQSPQKSSR